MKKIAVIVESKFWPKKCFLSLKASKLGWQQTFYFILINIEFLFFCRSENSFFFQSYSVFIV